MKTLIIDALFLYKDLTKSFDNMTSLEIIYKEAKKNNFDRYILLQNGIVSEIPDGIKNVILKDFSPAYILKSIYEEAKNSVDIVVINAGCPLYDENFVNKILERHTKYFSDYTYCMGYPEGLVPSVIRKEIIPEIIDLVKDDKIIKKDYLFYSISKDINSFDIETILSDFDLRIYRISLGLNDKGEEILTHMIYEKFKNSFSVDEIVNFFQNNIDQLYTTIYMAYIELTNYSPVISLYYPENREEKKQIDYDLFKKIILDLKNENQDINIVLGGIGEPLVHDNILEMINFIISNGLNLIIETIGHGINNDFINSIKDFSKEKIKFVVKLDAYDEQVYQIIHPGGNFIDVKNNILTLQKAGFKVFTQIMRMHETELSIEKYVQNKDVENLIIRKFSTFCDMLSDKKVVDLSPLDRIPCFHLRREIFIKVNGDVSSCFYSRFKDSNGNLKNNDLSEILDQMKDIYKNNAKKNYLDYCINCNDYYIFNF